MFLRRRRGTFLPCESLPQKRCTEQPGEWREERSAPAPLLCLLTETAELTIAPKVKSRLHKIDKLLRIGRRHDVRIRPEFVTAIHLGFLRRPRHHHHGNELKIGIMLQFSQNLHCRSLQELRCEKDDVRRWSLAMSAAAKEKIEGFRSVLDDMEFSWPLALCQPPTNECDI